MRLKAFTIFESTVAITIISIVLGISALIYSNVLHSETPVLVYQAKEEIDLLFNQNKAQHSFFTQQYEYESYTIQQTVDPYKGNQKLMRIDYSVMIADKSYWKESHLITTNE